MKKMFMVVLGFMMSFDISVGSDRDSAASNSDLDSSGSDSGRETPALANRRRAFRQKQHNLDKAKIDDYSRLGARMFRIPESQAKKLITRSQLWPTEHDWTNKGLNVAVQARNYDEVKRILDSLPANRRWHPETLNEALNKQESPAALFAEFKKLEGGKNNDAWIKGLFSPHLEMWG